MSLRVRMALLYAALICMSGIALVGLTYLLAPGLFADRIRDASLAAGAAAVSPALGAAPEVADVILDRYHEATIRERIAP